MKIRFIFPVFLFLLTLVACDQGEKYTYALIETEYGDMKVKLYNSTPKHRDNFIKLAKEGYYDGQLFHRVINNFMIQGGDPDSKGAPPQKQLGQGGPDYNIDAEFGALHVKGALAAARQGDMVNPEKKSSGSQFYIVQGRPVDEQTLNAIEQQKGIKYSPEQRQLYTEMGGTPFLDMDYTVFGEVVEGMEVIDKIAAVPTSQFSKDRPNEDIEMKVKIID